MGNEPDIEGCTDEMEESYEDQADINGMGEYAVSDDENSEKVR